MKTEVALLLLLACLCSGKNCPSTPTCKNDEMHCSSGNDDKGCPKQGQCVPISKTKLPGIDGHKCDVAVTCRNFCNIKNPRNKTICPPIYKSNSCQKPRIRRESLDKCPKPKFDKNGCRLCKGDERRCGPCCNKKESFCIAKYSSTIGIDGKMCPSPCQLRLAPQGQVRCPQAHDVNGCELPFTYVKNLTACP